MGRRSPTGQTTRTRKGMENRLWVSHSLTCRSSTIIPPRESSWPNPSGGQNSKSFTGSRAGPRGGNSWPSRSGGQSWKSCTPTPAGRSSTLNLVDPSFTLTLAGRSCTPILAGRSFWPSRSGGRSCRNFMPSRADRSSPPSRRGYIERNFREARIDHVCATHKRWW